MSDLDSALYGTSILLTRPDGRNDELVQCIEAQGAQAVIAPMLCIDPLDDAVAEAEISACLHQLFHTDLALFISTNAVHFAAEALSRRNLSWPKAVPCLGIGRATVTAIESYQWPLAGQAEFDEFNQQEDSERLLSHPLLADVDKRQLMIFRGQGGRAWLGQQLRERGAVVRYCELYRRSRPQWNIGELITMLKSSQPEVVVVASAETMQNFVYYVHRMAETELEWHKSLFALPVVVPSKRVADLAQASFANVWLAANASAKAVVDCICSNLLLRM